ncbi:MAG: LamG-like jellyroll fold domain-containing protein, partial [Gaiellaceae bacterium]
MVALAVAALMFAPISGTATTGLVAAYAFDEGSGATVTDQSGNGNNGTLTTTTWTTAGKYGGALSFNGTSSRVTIANAASLQLTTGMTLEAWVNPTTVSNAWRDVIYKGNDNYYLMGTTDQGGAPAGGGTFGNTNANAFATSALPANSWSYLATSYDGANLRLYLNGTLVSTVAKTGAITTTTNALTIGSDSFWGQYFSGLIDNIRIYNTALSQTQIQTDMTTPVAPLSPDTMPPSAPGTLSATAVSSARVDLSWGAASDNTAVTGYHIERCQGSGCSTFAEIGTTTTATSYSDTTTTAGTSYSYRIRANDAAANLGPYSNTATATTPNPDTTPPSAPGAMNATAISATRVDLSWGAATDNVAVTGYQIERCQGTGCNSFAQIGTTTTATSYSDTTATPNTSYSYRVRANDAANNLGAYTNTATTTTPAQTGPTPVAAYAFDEGSGATVTDQSGNGNNGTLTTTTWTTAGKYGGALSFNG